MKRKSKNKNLSIKFIVDDEKYFKDKWMSDGLCEEQAMRVAGMLPPAFRCIFTLTQNRNGLKYTLIKPDGKKLKMDSLNDYQRNVVIGECYDYFFAKQANPTDIFEPKHPCGVTEIKITH